MLRRAVSIRMSGTPPCPRRTKATAVPVASTEAQDENVEWQNAKPYNLIPGPKPLPIFGNILRFLPGGDFYNIDHLAMQRKVYSAYGPIARISKLPGRGDLLFVFNPEDACKVFRNEGPWPKRDVVPSIYYYRTVVRKKFFEPIGGALTAQGVEWHNFRSRINQIVMQPRSVMRYIDTVNEIADDFIERMRCLRDEKKELPVDFKNELHKWALESIAAISLDIRLGCLEARLDPLSEPQLMIDAALRIFQSLDTFLRNPYLWKFKTRLWKQFVKDLDLFADTALKYTNAALHRMKAQETTGRPTFPEGREPSILERLLSQDEPIVAAVTAIDLLLGGIDTTALSMSSVMRNLAKNPEAQELLAEEVRQVLPNREPVTNDMLQRMPRVRGFLKECLRLTPVASANVRQLPKNIVLSGYQIPENTEIYIGNLLMARQGLQRGEDLMPERWFRGQDAQAKPHPFAALPFGFGPRMCIGRRFAELEMLMLLTKIARNFRVEYHYGEFTYSHRFLFAPCEPLRFRLLERE